VESLAALRAIGVTVALDDFGTGASSLARLRDFPLDVLKLDRRFIAPPGGGEADPAFVAAVVSLADALGLEVVAEGIETARQAAMLLGVGCTVGQGFLFAAAEPDTTFVERIRVRLVEGAPRGPWAVAGRRREAS
jgi:diguanylate cyclase